MIKTKSKLIIGILLFQLSTAFAAVEKFGYVPAAPNESSDLVLVANATIAQAIKLSETFERIQALFPNPTAISPDALSAQEEIIVAAAYVALQAQQILSAIVEPTKMLDKFGADTPPETFANIEEGWIADKKKYLHEPFKHISREDLEPKAMDSTTTDLIKIACRDVLNGTDIQDYTKIIEGMNTCCALVEIFINKYAQVKSSMLSNAGEDFFRSLEGFFMFAQEVDLERRLRAQQTTSAQEDRLVFVESASTKDESPHRSRTKEAVVMTEPALYLTRRWNYVPQQTNDPLGLVEDSRAMIEQCVRLAEIFQAANEPFSGPGEPTKKDCREAILTTEEIESAVPNIITKMSQLYLAIESAHEGLKRIEKGLPNQALQAELKNSFIDSNQKLAQKPTKHISQQDLEPRPIDPELEKELGDFSASVLGKRHRNNVRVSIVNVHSDALVFEQKVEEYTQFKDKLRPIINDDSFFHELERVFILSQEIAWAQKNPAAQAPSAIYVKKFGYAPKVSPEASGLIAIARATAMQLEKLMDVAREINKSVLDLPKPASKAACAAIMLAMEEILPIAPHAIKQVKELLEPINSLNQILEEILQSNNILKSVKQQKKRFAAMNEKLSPKGSVQISQQDLEPKPVDPTLEARIKSTEAIEIYRLYMEEKIYLYGDTLGQMNEHSGLLIVALNKYGSLKNDIGKVIKDDAFFGILEEHFMLKACTKDSDASKQSSTASAGIEKDTFTKGR